MLLKLLSAHSNAVDTKLPSKLGETTPMPWLILLTLFLLLEL